MSERVETWAEALEAEAARGGAGRVLVIRETDSTQDAARRMGARAGDVVAAWRQRAGRGRLGSAWADTGEAGVAMTIVRACGAAERLAIEAAVTVAMGIEEAMSGHEAERGRNDLESTAGVRIKWPNDVMIGGRKVAGILIEQVDDVALVGIGVNVGQREWPAELAGRAMSLAEAGYVGTRLGVMRSIVRRAAAVRGWSDGRVVEEYGKRDGMVGRRARFVCEGKVVEGEVVGVEAMRGLMVRREDGTEAWLEAGKTRVVKS